MRTQNPSGQNRRSLFRAENSKFLGLTRFIALLVLLALPGAARAAGITWGVNTTISADTDVLTNGTPVFAFTWLSPAPTTVNGVSFTNSPALAGNTSNLVITSSSGLSSFATFGQGAAGTPYAALSSAYKAVIVGGTYVTAAPLTCTLNSLTVGRAYAVQVWVDDSRTLAVARTEVLTNAGGVPVTLNFNVNQVATAGNVGQFAIGIFTADNTNQAFTISGNAASQINGMQLRDVTGTGYMPPLQTIVTWNGGSTTNSNWSDAANWNGMIVQSNVTVVSGTFTGTTRQTNANDVTGLILKKITLSTSNWDVTGNPVTLNGSLSATAAGVSTWELDTLLSATPTISQTATGGVLNLTGVYSGSGGLTVASGAGAVTLSNPNNSFTGAVNVQGGTLNYASLAPGGQNSSLGAGTSKINVGTAGSASAFNYVGTASGAMDRGLFLTGNSTGGVTLNNNSANNSSLAFNADTLLTNATAGNVMTLNLGGVASGTTTFNGQLENANTSIGYFNGNLNVTGPGTWVFNNFIWFTNNVNIGTNTHFVLGVVGSNPNSSMLVNNIALNPGGVFDVSAYSQPAPFILGAYASFPQTMTAGRPDGTSATDINGNFALGGAALSIAGNGVPGTLTINGSFAPATSAGTSVINFDFGSTTNVGAAVSDLIQINGNLDLSQGVATVNLNPYQTSLQYNTPYTLISYTGSLNGNASGLAAPIFDRAHTGIISTATPNVVTVTFNASGNSPANHLLWNGASSSSWDLDTTPNWLNNGNSDYFFPLDNPFFDDTASQFNVNLVGKLSPGAVVTVTNNINAYTFTGSGSLVGSAGLVKQGAGLLTLDCSNSYAGGTLISAGTVALTMASAAGTGTITNNGALSFAIGSIPGPITMMNPIVGNGTINVLANQTVNLQAGELAGFSGLVTLAGGSWLSLSGTNSIGLTLQGNAQLGTASAGVTTITNNIGDGGNGYGLSVNSAGTLNLAGNNTYSGLTIVSNGVVNVTGNESATQGGWLMTNNVTAATANFRPGSTIIVGSTNLVQLGSSTSSAGTANETVNSFGFVTNNGILFLARAGILNINSNIWVQNGTMTNLPIGGYSSTLQVNTGGTFIYNGTNLIGLRPAPGNSGSGNLTINGGIFKTGQGFVNATVTNATVGAANLVLNTNGTLAFTANVPRLMTSLLGATNNFQLGNGGGVIDNGGYTITLPDVIANVSGQTGSLTLTNTGVVILTGTNTYTGATTIAGGRLEVNGQLASSGVKVNAGTILGGTGVISGTVSLAGTVSPGGTTNVATLNTGSETWTNGGAYVFGVSNIVDGSGQDLLNINGSLTLPTNSAAFTVKLTSLTAGSTAGALAGFNDGSSYSWKIATVSGSITNFVPGAITVDTTGFANTFTNQFGVTTNGNSLVLVYPYTAPTLTSPTLSGIPTAGGGAFNFSFSGPSGQTYKVLASTNLALPLANWTVLTSGTFGAGAVNYTDNAATNGQEFYRVTSP